MIIQTTCVSCPHEDETGNSFDSFGFCDRCRGVDVRTGLTDEQMKARVGLITSSVAGACLGLHPYMTEHRAWLAIRGEDNFVGNRMTFRGDYLERQVIAYLCTGQGRADLKAIGIDVGDMPMTWSPGDTVRHPELDWMGDTIDAIYTCNGIKFGVEGKTVSSRMASKWGDVGTDQVPDYVAIQTAVHLMCNPELAFCVIIALGGWDFDFKLYLIDRGEKFAKLEQMMTTQLGAWHQRHIIGGEAPGYVWDDEAWLRQFYADDSGPAIPATDELRDLALAYDRARTATTVAQKATGDLKVQLMALLGDAEGVAKADWGKVTYKATKKGSRVLRVTINGES